MYRVLVSKTFQREFLTLPTDMQARTRNALAGLEQEPFTSRPHADIAPLKDTHPKKYRMRVGDYRVVYAIEGNDVMVLDLFHRKHGYSAQ